MFWLKAPFAADAVIGLVGILLLVGRNGSGWWVVLFALIRAIIGAISVWVIAPRVLARRQDSTPSR
jgi:hypothetical protein